MNIVSIVSFILLGLSEIILLVDGIIKHNYSKTLVWLLFIEIIVLLIIHFLYDFSTFKIEVIKTVIFILILVLSFASYLKKQ